MHINVTQHPTQEWVRQQIRTATYEKHPKFLLHDNDGMFGQLSKPVSAEVSGKKVSCRSALGVWLAETQGIRGIPTPYRAPNAAGHIERFNGTSRRELLDPTSLLPWVGAPKKQDRFRHLKSRLCELAYRQFLTCLFRAPRPGGPAT